MRLPPRTQAVRFRRRRHNPAGKKIKIELGGYKTSPKLFEKPKKKHRKAKGAQMGFFDSVFSAHQPSLFGK